MTESNAAWLESPPVRRPVRRSPVFVPASYSSDFSSLSGSERCSSSTSDLGCEASSLRHSFTEPESPLDFTEFQNVSREAGVALTEERCSTEYYQRRSSSLKDLYQRRMKNVPDAMREEEYVRFTKDSSIYRCAESLKKFVLSDEKTVFVDNPFPECETLTLLRLLVTFYGDAPATVLYVNSSESMLDSLVSAAENFFVFDDVCSMKDENVLKTSVRSLRCKNFTDVCRISDPPGWHRICFLSDKQFLDLLTTNQVTFSLVVFDNFVCTTKMMMTCMYATRKLIQKRRDSGDSAFKTVVTFHGSLNPLIKGLFEGTTTIADEEFPGKAILYSEKTTQCPVSKCYLDEILSIVRFLVASQLQLPLAAPFGNFTKELPAIEGDILVFALSTSEAVMLQCALKRDFEWFTSWYQFDDVVKVVCLTEYSTADDLPASTSEKHIKIFVATDNATNIPRVPYVVDSGFVRRNYFNTSVASFCTEVIPISRYSADRRASYAVSFVNHPRIDEISIQTGGVVFRLFSLEQFSSLKKFDELGERNGESHMLSIYCNELKLNCTGLKILRKASERTLTLQFVRLVSFLNTEYLALLRDSREGSAVDFYRKLFIVAVLSLEPVFCCNREAKFLLDEANKFSSVRYFGIFVEKILNRLQGFTMKEERNKCADIFERIASFVKTRINATASALLKQSNVRCDLDDELFDDWTEYITAADVEHLYMSLHQRHVTVYKLETGNNVRFAVSLQRRNGDEFVLQPCDGIDFVEAKPSFGSFAFHILEMRQGMFFILSPVKAVGNGNGNGNGNHIYPLLKHCRAFRKVYVGPYGRRFLLPNGVSTMPLGFFGGPRNIFLSIACAHDPHTDVFVVGTDDADLDSATTVVDQIISTKYSELLNETCELSSHGVGKKNSSTIIVGAGGITLEHIFNNETRHVYSEKEVFGDALKRERRFTEKSFDSLGKPTIINAHDLFPTSGGLAWNLKRDVTPNIKSQKLTAFQRGVKFHTRSGKYSGVKCSCPKALTSAVGKITIDGHYSVQQVINTLLLAFPKSVVACKRSLNEDDIYVFDLSSDTTTNLFASVVRFALEPYGCKISEAFVMTRDEVEKKVLISKVDTVLQASLPRTHIGRALKVLRIDFEAKETCDVYVWGECKSDDLYVLVAEMRKTAASLQSKCQIDLQISAVFRLFYLLSPDEYMTHQTAVTKYCLGERELGHTSVEVSELPGGFWIVNFESCDDVLLDGSFQSFLKVFDSNKRLSRELYPPLFTRKGISWLMSLQDGFWPYLRVKLCEKPSTAVDLLVDSKIREQLEALIDDYCGRNSVSLLSADSELSSCCACFHTDEERKVVLECGHSICEDCRASWISVCVSEGRFPLCCPELNCQKIVVWKDIEKWLVCGKEDCLDCSSHDEMKKLSRSSYRRYLNGLENLHLLCSTPDCVGYFTKEVAKEMQSARCPECNVMKCMVCGACTHDDVSCEENEAMTKDSQRGLEYWIQKDPKNRRACVVCRMLIVKDAGCNHMHCRNCGTHFCWICDFISDEGVPGVYKHLYDAHRTFV
ncbi:hypothetical protein QR680_017463 [Steinernema hermaphroditum]|uniref:RING-type domain-containing protein n=1 Tax=Steinernema hermaphroditum TaxID=289476 RepID=A0AA39HFV1_9BILA|nr:hypothetical protein QR680_017463 [Steinernema hermaphroditum]